MLPAIFLCGDSTLAEKLPTYQESYYRRALAKGSCTGQKGDWVFIQFGHNDQTVVDPTRSATVRKEPIAPYFFTNLRLIHVSSPEISFFPKVASKRFFSSMP